MRHVLISLIRCYQYWVSPLFAPACRFDPTCSEYAAGAIDHYGVARGVRLALWRLLKCHPFHPGGTDPVA